MSAQFAFFIATMASWWWRKRDLFFFFFGFAVLAWLPSLIAANELFHRIGMDYMPTCLQDSGCRQDAVYSTVWLAISTATLFIEAYCAIRPRRKINT
jgi:hypothetical protein